MKKFVTWLLVCLMVVSSLPIAAFAEDAIDGCPGADVAHTLSNCTAIKSQEVVEPKCGEDGYTLYECECGKFFIANVVAKPLDHTYYISAAMVQTTCAKAGTPAYIDCSNANCDLKPIKVEASNVATYAAALGLTLEEANAKLIPIDLSVFRAQHVNSGFASDTGRDAGDCLSGFGDVWNCLACGEYIVPNGTGSVDHTWTFVEYTKEPTCSAAGSALVECEQCETEQTVAIAKLNHTGTYEGENIGKRIVPATNSTCTEKGMKKHAYCPLCDKYFTLEEDGDESDPADWTVETTKEKLEKDLAHSFMDTFKAGTIPDAGFFWKVSPNCEEAGIGMWHCTFCKKDIEMDNTQLGDELEWKMMHGGGNIKAANIKEKVKEAASCGKEGKTIYYCETCFEYKEFKTAATNAHKKPSDEDDISTTEATCLSDEYISYTCARSGCGKPVIEYKEGTKLDHKIAYFTVPATCSTPEYTYAYCERGDKCGVAAISSWTINSTSYKLNIKKFDNGTVSFYELVDDHKVYFLGITSVGTETNEDVHLYNRSAEVAATCTTDGSANFTCTNASCPDPTSALDNVFLPATGHSGVTAVTTGTGSNKKQVTAYQTCAMANSSNDAEKNAYGKKSLCSKGCVLWDMDAAYAFKGQDTATANYYTSADVAKIYHTFETSAATMTNATIVGTKPCIVTPIYEVTCTACSTVIKYEVKTAHTKDSGEEYKDADEKAPTGADTCTILDDAWGAYRCAVCSTLCEETFEKIGHDFVYIQKSENNKAFDNACLTAGISYKKADVSKEKQVGFCIGCIYYTVDDGDPVYFGEKLKRKTDSDAYKLIVTGEGKTAIQGAIPYGAVVTIPQIKGTISFTVPTGHDFYDVTKTSETTCTKDGVLAAHVRCDNSCGLYFQTGTTDVLATPMTRNEADTAGLIEKKYEHVASNLASNPDNLKGEIVIKEGDATCTDAAYKLHYCDICKELLIKTAASYAVDGYAPATGHTLDKTEILVEDPTCTKEGYKYYPCTADDCDYKEKIEMIPAKGHTNAAGQTFKADCTDKDVADRVCVDPLCDAVEGDGEGEAEAKTGVINVLHNWTEWTVSPADCFNDGYALRICLGCGEKETKDVIKHLEHDPAIDWIADAEDSNKENLLCKRCGTVLETRELAGTVTYTMSIDNALVSGANFAQGSIVAVTISISAEEAKIWGHQLKVEFSDDLKFIGAEFKNANFPVLNAANAVYSVESNYVNVVANAANDPETRKPTDYVLSGTEELVVLNFRIMGTASDAVEGFDFTAKEDVTFSITGNCINAAQNANSIISEAASFDYAQFLDVNGDSDTTIADILTVFEIMEDGLYDATADVNKDGSVDYFDAELLQQYIIEANSAWVTYAYGIDADEPGMPVPPETTPVA